jgi:hypothetical protein
VSRPVVEVLYAKGCPNREPALALVRRVARELQIDPEIRLIEVSTGAAAKRLRFLGSPTIRVDGQDVDPTAEAQTMYALGCRLFAGQTGLTGTPDPALIGKALRRI